MAAAGGGAAAVVKRPPSPAERLFAAGYEFDFFQAVRLLERLARERARRQKPDQSGRFQMPVPVGLAGPPDREVVRFRAQMSLAFPASAVHEIQPGAGERPQPEMVVTFMGLTGPSGALPQHYTQWLMDLHRDVRGAERRALRDWLALFDHRAVSLFYRAWEKYRFWVAFERGEADRRDPDAFTLALFSLIGLGERPLRRRLHVVARPAEEGAEGKELARVNDLSLLFYGGLLAHRPRHAWGLAVLVSHYFGLPAAVEQFRGRWLTLPTDARSDLGGPKKLGVDTLAGRRVWDVRSRFRLRLGPMGLPRFEEFLPDRGPVPQRKALFLLSQLVRLYIGPGLQFDVQLLLKAAEVPRMKLAKGGLGVRLGWNTWLLSRPATADRGDAVFPSVEVTQVG